VKKGKTKSSHVIEKDDAGVNAETARPKLNKREDIGERYLKRSRDDLSPERGEGGKEKEKGSEG